MPATLDRPPAGLRAMAVPRPAVDWPRLLAGTEPLGQVTGSGLKDPPFLIRRSDGQIVQVSRVLYAIACRMDGRDVSAIAAGAGAELGVRIAPELIGQVAEAKLAPLGLTPFRDGRVPVLEPRNGLLALKCRVGVLREGTVNAIARPLTPLFRTPVVVAAVTALVAFDLWLGLSHGVTAALSRLIESPGLFLALFAVTILSLAFHEFGHAAACRYGGARPGRIGVGLYLVWPVFFTDVTDSYRLPKRARLRTDLGGVYFNALWALAAGGAYLATSYSPFAIVVITQQVMILDQFMPWIRLDGYHVVSDLIGVSDLFSRIKPVMRSLVPRRPPDPRVLELKAWARGAVTIWVLTTVTALIGMLTFVAVNAPAYVQRVWISLLEQLATIGRGVAHGSAVMVLIGGLGTGMLALSAAAMTFTYLLLCRGIGAALAVRRTSPRASNSSLPISASNPTQRSEPCTSALN